MSFALLNRWGCACAPYEFCLAEPLGLCLVPFIAGFVNLCPATITRIENVAIDNAIEVVVHELHHALVGTMNRHHRHGTAILHTVITITYYTLLTV